MPKPRKGGIAPPSSHRHLYNIWVYRNFVRPANTSSLNISEYQFSSWLTPSSPVFHKQLQAAIDGKDWSKVVSIAHSIHTGLATSRGIYPAKEKPSNHEFVIRDILYLVGQKFSYQQSYTIPNTHSEIVPDFQFADGRIFEVFGYRSDDYRERAEAKSKHLYDILWYLDLIDQSIKAHQITLLLYARMLDTQVNHKEQHGLALFAGGVEEMLKRIVPLFLGANFKLCKNYLFQIAKKSDQWMQKRRDRLDVQKHKTFPQPKLVEDMPSDFLSFAGVKNASAPSLEEIEAELKQEFWSVDEWSDEEKVAVYFKTPKALVEAMESTESGLRMVARNWYHVVKMAAKEDKPLVSYDFDSTLTKPRWSKGYGEGYWAFTADPNYEMINKLKQHLADGHPVIIVTARSEADDEHMEIAVHDFMQLYDIPDIPVYYTGGDRKGPLLKSLGCSLHHDDSIDEILSCKEHGIPFHHVQPPDEDLNE